jgi:hypothetical protein
MRRHGSGRGCGACGQGGTHSLLPGGAGIRPGTLRPPARSSLMVRSNPAEGVSRQKRGPDAGKTPRWSAAGRSVLRQRTRTPLQGVIEMWRHAALRPLGFCPGSDKGRPAPPRRSNNRGGEARPHPATPTLSRPQLSGIPPKSQPSGRCFAATFLAWSARFPRSR